MKTKKLLTYGCLLIVFVIIFMLVMTGGAFALTFSALKPGGNSTTGTSAPQSTDAPKDKAAWLEVFKNAETALKIPWEFVAAIMWQESGIGNNFGNCSYFPPAPGGHVLTENDGLRSSEDQIAFKEIVTKLNYETNKGVSCNPPGSNGGAMGYMQVMPREWQANAGRLYDSKITATYPDPWNAQDSVYVGALILKRKIGLEVGDTFPEDVESIKRAAGKYYGNDNIGYANSVYAKYLEIKASGQLP